MKNIYLSDLKIALRLAMRRADDENCEVMQGVDDAASAIADQLEMTEEERKAFMDYVGYNTHPDSPHKAPA